VHAAVARIAEGIFFLTVQQREPHRVSRRPVGLSQTLLV